jgi:hypothetical protein
MSDKKISELTALTAPDGAEELVVNDSGTSKKITQTNLLSTALPLAGGTMTGTIAGFTSTGIDDNATSTAITIDSLSHTTIKGTNPNGGGVLNLENTTAAVNGTDWGSLNFISNDTSTGASGIRASITAKATSFNGDGNLVFETAPSNGVNTERMRITSTGDVNVNTGNLVIGTSGKGIDFSAATPDGTGTVTSEVLDDYEEGTFTPTLVTGTATVVNASYTKIGNIVTATCTLGTFSNRSSTAVVEIEGLPFAGKTARHVGSLMGRYTDVSANNLYMAASTKLHVYGNSSGVWVQLKHSDLNNASSQIYCSITYQT